MKGFLAELRRRDSRLFAAGALHLGLAALFLAGLFVDTRQVLGINPWVKPFKFAISIWIFLWTLGWLMAPLRARRPREVTRIGNGAIVAMLFEIVLIALQSARGTPSHFNHAGVLNEAVFGIMGLMILANTLLMVWLLKLFMEEDAGLPPPYLLAVRLGLGLLLLGSLQGGFMVANDAHSVGGRDGGPGLPFVNFSTTHGDLRPAHALGLHALQALPLFAFFLERRGIFGPGFQWRLVLGAGVLYLIAFLGAWAWAISGRPLLAL